jgi:hypothetical protein
MYGHISDNYCLKKVPSMVSTDTGEDEGTRDALNPLFGLYPNPTSGNFTIVQLQDKIYESVTVEVYNMSGAKVMTGLMQGENKHAFKLSGMNSGLYFVKISGGGAVQTIKLVKL